MAGLILLAALIGVPLAEIALFIEVGGAIGTWPTVALVVLTALIGTALLRQQGLATLGRARAELARQALPVRELFDGACLLFAGALLLTPGFLTDAVGFLLLVPPLRAALRRFLAGYLQRHGAVHVYHQDPGAQNGGGETVIEGDYQEADDPPGTLPRSTSRPTTSPWRDEH